MRRHARDDHGLNEIPFELVLRVRFAISDEPPGVSRLSTSARSSLTQCRSRVEAVALRRCAPSAVRLEHIVDVPVGR